MINLLNKMMDKENSNSLLDWVSFYYEVDDEFENLL